MQFVVVVVVVVVVVILLITLCVLCVCVQSTLSDFIKIEMMFHAKSLEMYTQCFNSLNSINEENDMQVQLYIVALHIS